jgi:hypothetical protein
VTDPYRSRPPVFPRARLLRAGLDEARVDLADEYRSLSYREQVSFARFVNAHGDDAIRDRIDSADVTAGTTQPTGGHPTDEQQIAQLDAAAASTPLAPPPPPEAEPTETPSEEAPTAVASSAPEPAAPSGAADPAPAPDTSPAPEPAAPTDQAAAGGAPAPETPTDTTTSTEPGPVVVAGIEVAPDPDTLNQLTMDQLRAVATELPGVTPTGRKADLVSKIAPAVADLADQQATGDQPAADTTPADTTPPDTPAPPAEAPQVTAEPPAEAPAPEPAPDAPTGPQEAPQTPAATDGTTTEGTTTP